MDSNRTALDFASNPKLRLLDRLIKQCFLGNVSNSQVITSNPQNYGDMPWCPRTFDGFACWDDTPAGAVAVQPCPGFIVGFDSKRYAHKICSENGTWFQHPEVNKPWTNYTTCVDFDDLHFRTTVNNIYVFGYSVSIAALLLSLLVFFHFRSLQCTRIRVHINLFTAFTLNNILWIVWYKTVVNKADVVHDNKVWCQVLHVVTHYFMISSYFWMFCEGLHLHISLVVVFVKEGVAMMWFMSLGWGLSLVIVLAYAFARLCSPGATERCWIDHSDTFWIIIVPVVVSLLASFVFLINVVRVLLTKLNPVRHNQNHTSEAARKATRAALILIPLFGLHFILIPLRPTADSPLEKIYQVASALLTSLQGVCLAILFCFTNHDVVSAARDQFARHFSPNHGGGGHTGVTGGESLMLTRENVV